MKSRTHEDIACDIFNLASSYSAKHIIRVTKNEYQSVEVFKSIWTLFGVPILLSIK